MFHAAIGFSLSFAFHHSRKSLRNVILLARGQFDDKQIIDTQEKPIGDKLSQPTFGVIQEYFHYDGIQAKTNNHKS